MICTYPFCTTKATKIVTVHRYFGDSSTTREMCQDHLIGLQSYAALCDLPVTFEVRPVEETNCPDCGYELAQCHCARNLCSTCGEIWIDCDCPSSFDRLVDEEVCLHCGGQVGHLPNCPEGIATIRL